MTGLTGEQERWVVELAQEAAAQAVERILSHAGTMKHRMGTVVDADDPGENLGASVIPDGSEEAIGAGSVMTQPVFPGDRVSMLMVPPHGALIVGKVGGEVAMGAVAFRNAGNTVTSGTRHTISWQDANQWNGEFWDSGLPTRLACPYLGKYSVVASSDWQANTTEQRELTIRHQPTNLAMSTTIHDGVSTNATKQNASSGLVDCAVGDYFVIEVVQVSGITLTLNGGLGQLTTARIQYHGV